jgi:hypothetical protein
VPCFDPRDDKQNEIDLLNGIICALVNELERREILVDVVTEAQRNGKINIFRHIEEHINNDITRLAADIAERYSKDELMVIEMLLRKDNVDDKK